MQNKFFIFLLFLLSHVTLAACDSHDTSSLQEIKQRGKLIILTTNHPTTYYYDRDNQLTGPEYDMTQSFAHSLKLEGVQLEVEYRVYDSIKELIEALRNNEGDIAAAGLTVTDERKKEFDFGPVYQKTNEYIVCHRNQKAINTEKDIAGLEIVIAADSSYLESMKQYADVTFTVSENLNTSDLIEQIANEKTGCTISDSTLFNIERRYHTEIQNKYTLARGSELAWMLNKHNEGLLKAVNNWFKQYRGNNELKQMLDKYYGFVEILDYVDTHKFLNRIKTRLPKYKAMFIAAATENNLDASLLAAQSYQESHWNAKAKSPTGVRGIMMLTQPVAKSLGVTNRLDAKQNISAGAKFLAKMRNMVEEVAEPDRSWLALAAYNIGRGHFRDAQELARKLNKNPDLWHEMKEVLPLLSQKEYYKDLNYGYARGNEPVSYVTRIRGYDELLHKYFSGETK